MSNEPVDFCRLEQQFEALMKSRESIGSGNRKKAQDGQAREYAFRFLEEYAQWRYEHRGLSMLVSTALFSMGTGTLLITAWLLAATSFGQALGLDTVRARATNAYYAALWATRGAEGAETAPVYPKRYSGAIEKIIDDILVVVYYEDGKQYRRLVKPANVITTDRMKFKEWANQYHLKGISIEFYEPLGEVAGHQVWGSVMWYRKTPINVELVELGIGYPEKNPPTAVVNKIFALYYWHKAQTGQE
jgi:hypothetical protein